MKQHDIKNELIRILECEWEIIKEEINNIQKYL